MTGVIAIVLVLGGLIFFHELGHFLMARVFVIGVKTFSIGFGPRLFSFRRRNGKTRYQIAAIPLGGFVSLVGEQAAEEVEAPFTLRESFALRPPSQRLLVILAGPVFNLLLAWVIYTMLLANGQMLTTEIGTVLPDSPAASFIQPGDRLTKIGGRTVTWWEEISLRLNIDKSPALAVELERDGRLQTFDVAPQTFTFEDAKGKEHSVRRLGVQPSGRMYEGSLPACVLEGLQETGRKVVFMGEMLGLLFTGQVPMREIGGPVFIAQAVHSQATNQGPWEVLSLAALLSINLGILNLLPIPALDGGHIFFGLIELVCRRPVPEKIQAISMYAGFFLLITLLLVITGNDLLRLFTS